MKKQIGYIGLGKMGLNMSRRLLEHQWEVVGYNKEENATEQLEKAGGVSANSIDDMFLKLDDPALVWIMVPHTAVDEVIDEIKPHIKKDSIIIDGGNSPYTLSMQRAITIKEMGGTFLDVGVSGGPEGARHGACTMIGGDRDVFIKYEQLFKDISAENGYRYIGDSGSGHFVKMVHNGIEYGMMQAIAEGFDIMKHSEFDLDLEDIADIYNHGSVIESRLMQWMGKAFKEHGQDLEKISGSAQASGEGAWTIKAAHELGISADVIEEALMARMISQMTPTYQGKIISALRNQFGGHNAKKK